MSAYFDYLKLFSFSNPFPHFLKPLLRLCAPRCRVGRWAHRRGPRPTAPRPRRRRGGGRSWALGWMETGGTGAETRTRSPLPIHSRPDPCKRADPFGRELRRYASAAAAAATGACSGFGDFPPFRTKVTIQSGDKSGIHSLFHKQSGAARPLCENDQSGEVSSCGAQPQCHTLVQQFSSGSKLFTSRYNPHGFVLVCSHLTKLLIV